MLYLEDYLEMIEHLPQELRDRFTEMREMDLQVQNAIDSLDERVKVFFGNAKKMKQVERDSDYEKINQDYYKALEDADEKVHIANQIYDLVERYLRRLDQELQKFKMELEADNSGITEVLERRSLELDNPPPPMNVAPTNNIKVEKRKHTQHNVSSSYPPEKRAATEKVLSSIASEAMRETMAGNRVGPLGHSSSSSSSSSTSSNSSAGSITERTTVLAPQTKNHPFGGGNALAAAASQAIAATQQSLKRTSSQSQSNVLIKSGLKKKWSVIEQDSVNLEQDKRHNINKATSVNQLQQGRRTASLKASYDAINSGFQNLSKEFTIGAREISSMASVAPTVTSSNVTVTTEPKTKSNKKTSRANHSTQPVEPPPPCDDSEDSSMVDENGTSVDWSFDPNEPRYCICNQVSYGDMVACDNEDCPFEWFHYPCVGITQPPKGKWYCPQCTASMRRRGRKEK